MCTVAFRLVQHQIVKVGVYKIYNIVNHKCYIGSTARYGFTKRRSDHFSSLKRNNHHSIHLQRAWHKYGPDAFVFEILEECESLLCIEREQYYMDTLLFASCNDQRFHQLGYNICRIAGGTLGTKRSEETRKKIGLTKLGNKYCLGRKASRESRERMRQSHLGIQAGEQHPMAKLSQQDVIRIRKLLSEKMSPKYIAQIFDVSRRTVYDIKLGKTWTHI